MKLLLPFLAALAASAAVHSSRAAEPFLKPNDVIALVGGEDLFASGGEYGFLEFNLQRALPGFHLKVRNLAWEGDTVFEQPRMLNYPKLEQQLDEIGATVVMVQFGQMESMDGNERLPAFVEAYERLIVRLQGKASVRRLVIVSPIKFCQEPLMPDSDSEIALRRSKFLARFGDAQEAYRAAIKRLADRDMVRYVDVFRLPPEEGVRIQRDGVHLTMQGYAILAEEICRALGCPQVAELPGEGVAAAAKLIPVIKKKNRLWDRYSRPQNWAFLAGDRTTQPSSHDHRDSSRRWFPEEMKEFIPLIEAREREIWDLAAKLNAEKN